jgi:hypothetical protein
MYAIGGDHNVGFGKGAIFERDQANFAVALKARAAMAGAHDSGRECGSQHIDEVGAVHSVCCVPARRIRYLYRGNEASVVAIVARAFTYLCAPLLYGRSKPDPLQMPDAVRRYVNAGTDLTECRRLFIDRHL